MSEEAIPYVSRLSDYRWVDRWAFLIFAFGGAAGILIAKVIGVRPIPVAAGAAITMTAYAALMQVSGTGRLRSDQAGDNCYYLGLIFTLTSLAYAIFFFDPSNTATNIVQGFGIALATTIMGLVLRVFFNQSRVDLVETEDRTRIELQDAASRLKAQLSAMTVSMNDFGRETRQSLEELREGVLKALEDTREASIAAVSETASSASAAIQQQSDSASTQAARLGAAADAFVVAIEGQVQALASIRESSDGIGVALAEVRATALETNAAVSGLAEQAALLRDAQAEVRSTGEGVHRAVAQLSEGVGSLHGSIGSFDAKVDSILSGLRENANSLSETQRQVTSSLAKQAEEAVALVGRHNNALEQELSRSRANVTKVHSSLAEMTEELANRLEAQAAE